VPHTQVVHFFDVINVVDDTSELLDITSRLSPYIGTSIYSNHAPNCIISLIFINEQYSRFDNEYDTFMVFHRFVVCTRTEHDRNRTYNLAK